jgi:rRNA maturation RNase YbeY
VVLVLTDDAGMTPLNRAFFGKNRPTDVISVAYPPLPGRPGSGLNEVYVNVERAAQVARSPGHRARELALYVAHGIHHLTGASDHTPALRARMRREELAWLNEAGRLGLVAKLVN